MREHRAAAITAGLLYITGTVAGVVSTAVVSAPVRDARDPLAYAVDHSGAMVTTGLLILAMGLSLAFIPVVLFRVLRPVDETLGLEHVQYGERSGSSTVDSVCRATQKSRSSVHERSS